MKKLCPACCHLHVVRDGRTAASVRGGLTAACIRCDMTTKRGFEAAAKAVMINVAGTPLIAEPRRFSTGSVGWMVNGKAEIELANGDRVKVQISGNLIAVGSKDWAEGDVPTVIEPEPAKPIDPTQMSADELRELKKAILLAERAAKKAAKEGGAV